MKLDRSRFRSLLCRLRCSLPRPSRIPWLIVALLLLSDVSLLSQSSSKEYQLKAAFLFNFTKFVEWNAGASGGPITIVILGSPAFGNEVENAVRNRKVNGRPLSVKSARNAAEARDAHLLFISAEEDGRVA